MKISECVKSMKNKSKAFVFTNNFTNETELALEKNYDLIVINNGTEEQFESILLGTYIHEENLLQFPYDKDNLAIPDDDREMYLTLQKFAIKNKIIELSETNISFDSAVLTMKQIKSAKKGNITRNTKGEIKSSYSLEEVLAIAATFHKSKAIFPLTFDEYTVFLSICE